MLDRLLAEPNVVSLHCPLLPDTKHLINADTLAKAKRGFTHRVLCACITRCQAERVADELNTLAAR